MNQVFPKPSFISPRREHLVAAPSRTVNLQTVIPEQLEILTVLRGCHVLSARHFDAVLMAQIFRLAASYESGERQPKKNLSGRILASAFLDQQASRSQLSFDSAWLRLGGSVMPFGEAFQGIRHQLGAMADIAELCNSHGDLVVLRTGEYRAFQEALAHFRIPVINAGDGVNERPVHALTDLYTLAKWQPERLLLGKGAGLTVGVLGWPASSRTLRSFLLALSCFPTAVKQIVVMSRQASVFADGQREELTERGLHIALETELVSAMTPMAAMRTLVPTFDVVYIDEGFDSEMSREAIQEAVGLLKSDALVLHTGQRSDEVRAVLDDSPYNGYYHHTRAGVFVRMAVLASVMGVL